MIEDILVYDGDEWLNQGHVEADNREFLIDRLLDSYWILKVCKGYVYYQTFEGNIYEVVKIGS